MATYSFLPEMNPSLRYVDHTYRDFSNYVEQGGQIIKHKKCEHNFPAKVHLMLSNEDNSLIIAWMPHGRAFRVLDKKALVSTLLPEYLVCKQYSSFSRQLNGWGFKRLYQSGPDMGCYYHECFLRGLPKLTRLIRRLDKLPPDRAGRSTPYAAGEPNFYRISEQYPLLPRAGSTSEQGPQTNAAKEGAGDEKEEGAPASSSDAPSSTSQDHARQSSSPSIQASIQDTSTSLAAVAPSHDHLQSGSAMAAAAAAAAPSQNENQYQLPPQEYPIGSAVPSTVPVPRPARWTPPYPHYIPHPYYANSHHAHRANYPPGYEAYNQHYHGSYQYPTNHPPTHQVQPHHYEYQPPQRPPHQYYHDSYPPQNNFCLRGSHVNSYHGDRAGGVSNTISHERKNSEPNESMPSNQEDNS